LHFNGMATKTTRQADNGEYWPLRCFLIIAAETPSRIQLRELVTATVEQTNQVHNNREKMDAHGPLIIDEDVSMGDLLGENQAFALFRSLYSEEMNTNDFGILFPDRIHQLWKAGECPNLSIAQRFGADIDDLVPDVKEQVLHHLHQEFRDEGQHTSKKQKTAADEE
jgi:hypothetical protein